MNTDLQVIERSPSNDVAFGQKAAKALMDVVKGQGLARKFGGQKEHLFVEAWQLLGQFAGLSAEVRDAEPIEVEGVKGAKAHVVLVNNEGDQMGGAVAYCMRDEPNWKNKPWFQLASMAQTRAVSKAFRNRLSWIAVLAGYSGTPAEEMDGVHLDPTPHQGKKSSPSAPERVKDAPDLEELKAKAIAAAKEFNFEVDDLEGWLEVKQENWGMEEINRIRVWYKEQKTKR